jgi:heat shock protein 4
VGLSLEETEAKYNALVATVEELCHEFLTKRTEEAQRVEAELEKAAQEAQDEKMANGEEDDYDNRKLKKADRMRLVVKNKEEGTEIFKGGVWRTAAARYHKALTHCSKFFDLTPADEEEVKGIKTSLYLNLAQCYLKMDQSDHAINQCTLALENDPRSAKAYYRRALARESKKLYEEALEDAMNAQAEMVVPDKGVNTLVQKLKKIIAAEKKKEKDTWAGAFGSGKGKKAKGKK